MTTATPDARPDQPYIVTDTATGRWLPGLPTFALIEATRGHAWQMAEGVWRLADSEDDEEAVYRAVTVVPTNWLCLGAGCDRTHRVGEGHGFACPEHVPEVLGDADPHQPYPFDGIPTSPKVPVDMSTQTSDDAPVNTTTPGASPEKESLVTTTTKPRARKPKATDAIAASIVAMTAETPAEVADAKPRLVVVSHDTSGLPADKSGRIPAMAGIMTGYPKGLGLVAQFKGQTLTATVLPDGTVVMGEERYTSPSKAATVAVSRVNAAKASINGWTFWKAVLPSGDTVGLDTLRAAPVTVGTVRESAPDAPRLPKVRVLGPAQREVARIEALSGAEYVAAIGSDAGQAILEAASKESLGAARREADEALPF